MNTNLLVFSVFLFFFAWGPAFATDSAVSQLDEFLSSQKKLSGYVHVTRGDELLYSKGFGFAVKRERKRNQSTTLFDTGSISKQFVATVLQKMAEEGQLSLDQKISHWYQVPENKKEITLLQLIRHESGLDYPNLSDRDYDLLEQPQQFFELMLKKSPFREPGKFNYNNLVYGLLAHVVEKVSGKKYQTKMLEVFRSMGLEKTGFNQLPGSVDLSNSAMGYDEHGRQFLAGRLPSGWGFHGATGIVTDVQDLTKWVRLLFQGKIISDKDLILTTGPSKQYGLGWFVGPGFAYHEGATYGFVSFVSYDPTSDVLYVAYSNQFDKSQPIFDGAEFFFKN